VRPGHGGSRPPSVDAQEPRRATSRPRDLAPRSPASPGLGASGGTPDSDALSLLLGLHSRPQSGVQREGSATSNASHRSNGSAPACVPPPVGSVGHAQQASARPGSRDEAVGSRPPRAPSSGAPGMTGLGSERRSSRPPSGSRSSSSTPLNATAARGHGQRADIGGAHSSLLRPESDVGRSITPRQRLGAASQITPAAPASVDEVLSGLTSVMAGATIRTSSPGAPAAGMAATAGLRSPAGGVASALNAAPAAVLPPWGGCARPQTAVMVSQAQDPNQEFRNYMEDGYKVVDPLLEGGRRGDDSWGFFAVYDGHGGRSEVDYVEQKLHEVVLGELRQLPPNGDVKGALVTAFKKIDGQLAMLGAWNSGCTCTVAVARRQASGVTLYVANVGDSRAVLCGGGVAKRVSIDHRAIDASEARRVQEEGGMVRHGRVGGQLSVSRSLGDHNLKGSGVSCVPDVSCSEFKPEDPNGYALVIGSDGLWDTVEDEEARKVVAECVARSEQRGGGHKVAADSLKEDAARSLVARAKERGSRDNILALVVFF